MRMASQRSDVDPRVGSAGWSRAAPVATRKEWAMSTEPTMARPRSTGRRLWPAIGVVLLAASVAACGGGSGERTGATRLPSPSPQKTRTSGTAGHRRAPRCHLVSARVLAAGVDRTTPIPCSQRHNLETIGTHPVYGKVDHSVLQQYGADCRLDGINTLHLHENQVARIDVEPMVARTPGGRSIIRCDALIISGVGRYFGSLTLLLTKSLW